MKITPERPDTGQKYKNEFKENNQYPFCDIGRVLTDINTGAIVQELNELDSTLDKNGYTNIFNADLHDYMVKFPKFYYRRVWNGDTLEEYILGNVPPKKISQIPKTIRDAGYEVYPCFVDPNGNIRDYVLIGAIPGYIVNEQLRSIPRTGELYLADYNISKLRSASRYGRDFSFNPFMIEALSMLRLLFKFAFNTLDFRVIKPSTAPSKYVYGQTLGLGNRTGYVNSNYCSLFGIEGIMSCSELVDGIYWKTNSSPTTAHIEVTYCLNEIDIDDFNKYIPANIEELIPFTGSSKIVTSIMRSSKFLYIPKKFGSGTSVSSGSWSSTFKSFNSSYVDSTNRYCKMSYTAGFYSHYWVGATYTNGVAGRLYIKPKCL